MAELRWRSLVREAWSRWPLIAALLVAGLLGLAAGAALVRALPDPWFLWAVLVFGAVSLVPRLVDRRRRRGPTPSEAT